MELDRRFFSQNNIRTALRKLGMGIDNAYLTHLIETGVVPEPDISEFTVKLWSFYKTVALIEFIYKLKNKMDELDREEIVVVLEKIKTKSL